MGSLEAKGLHSLLADLALESANDDERSSRIKAREALYLHCRVSLIPAESIKICKTLEDWEIGKHGVRVQIEDSRDPKSCLAKSFLPGTIVNRGWTKAETVEQGLRGAGFKGQITPQVLKKTILTRFEVSSEASMTYQEFKTLFQQDFQAVRETGPSIDMGDKRYVRLKRRAMYLDAPEEAQTRKVKQQKGNRVLAYFLAFLVAAVVIIAVLKYYSETYNVEYEDFLVNFSILGLPENAEMTKVRKAFHELSLKWHPDKNPGCKTCADTFIKISKAYKQISDLEKGVLKLVHTTPPAGARPVKTNPFY